MPPDQDLESDESPSSSVLSQWLVLRVVSRLEFHGLVDVLDLRGLHCRLDLNRRISCYLS